VVNGSYLQEGKSITVQVVVQATIVFGGTGTTYIEIPLPVTPISVGGSQQWQSLAITLQDGSSLLVSSQAIFTASGSSAIFNPNFSGVTVTIDIYMDGRYQAA
jgi:hypothetical protein